MELTIMGVIKGKPVLAIEKIDDDWTIIRATFNIDWGDSRFRDNSHRILVQVWGEDDGLRGRDDYLGEFFSPAFRLGLASITVTERVQTGMLNEDNIGKDEIYVRGQMQVWTQFYIGRPWGWVNYEDRSSKSNRITDKF